MKASHPWHHTALGTAIRWLGSIQLAVPVLVFVALAMAWGTYLESTQSAKVARAEVYGSWWFIALMGLVCVSLIFAAASRFPWQRRHVGFLVVHASLVALIAGGFWSMFGRIEGRIALDQGMSSSVIEMSEDQLEVVEHDRGTFKIVDAVPAPTRPGSVTLAGLPLQIVELWENVQETFDVVDNAPEPYRAVQIAFGPTAASEVWVGDEARGEAPVIDGLRVRVLSADSTWTPPASPTPTSSPAGSTQSASDAPATGSYAFVLGDQKFPLAAEGAKAFEGWTITKINRFSHASVVGGSLTNETSKQENPAVEVIISDSKGSTERHTAFELFPDMTLSKTMEGNARSGAKLVPLAQRSRPGEETLVIYGTPPLVKFAHIAKDGAVTLKEHAGEFPFLADFGARKLTIRKHFTHAKEVSNFARADRAKDSRPAVLVKLGDSLMPLAWKASLPVDLGGRPGLLRFGPRNVQLPFTVRLDEFRKMDYPGTEMAMAYESGVTVTSDSEPEQTTTISMNNPLAHSGWKVYQSGFQGATVSIFSVMRDPGLPLTYIACTTLCIGIVITFYGRGLSWGHPGIPLPFAAKESSRVSSAHSADAVAHRPVDLAGLASPTGSDHPHPHPLHSHPVAAAPGGAPDSGRRASDAPGYLRA